MYPTISVIVPVYNGGEKFRDCLQSLQALSPSPHELIVVDDASSDDSAALAARYGANTIRLSCNRGPAHARNQGGQIASGDILYFVDADVTVYPDAIARLQALFHAPDAPDAVIGSYDDTPQAENFASLFKNLMHHYVHQHASEEASTFWGACGAIRRTIFLQMGGFNAERYPLPSIEDIEFGYRLTDAGYTIRLDKELQVTHLKRWTLYSQWHTDFFRRALPWTALLLNRDITNDLNLQWSSRISTALVLILAVSAAGIWLTLWMAVVALLAIAGLLWLNAGLYRFFARKRGVGFLLPAIGWHWFYYLYSGIAFVTGYVRHHLSQRTSFIYPSHITE